VFRCLAILVLLLVVAPSAAQAGSIRIVELAGGGTVVEGAGQGCETSDPRRCDAYELLDFHHGVADDEPLVLRYRVSEVDHWYATAKQLRAATARGARAWEAANPRLRFVDEGTTPLPVTHASNFDGVNSVGFGPIGVPTALAAAYLRSDEKKELVEWDIILGLERSFASAPCEQADGACAGAGGFDLMPGTTFAPIESVVTHELGHVLGLLHPIGEHVEELTMHGTQQDMEERRIAQTLGLGDILGVREKLPCGDCGGPPRVFVP
jgi:hypothetical protein